MPSPFPGVDPYLENPELWAEVHNRLIVAIADHLNERLSEKYRVAIERRVYLSSPEETLMVGIPDMSLAVKESANPAQSSAPTVTLLETESVSVTVPLLEEVKESFLEIRDVKTGRVITVIEILSPKNKRSGEGRDAYERKRNQVLLSQSHLIEIDLLRGGQPMLVFGAQPSQYRVLVSRGDRRPTAQLYPFSLREPAPRFPIPLLPQDEEPILDLQMLLDQVYQRGRYHLAIDYTEPLKPALLQDDATWVEEQLRQQNFR